MKQPIFTITKCRICDSENIIDFLMLGDLPIPNGFLDEKNLKDVEPKFPLTVSFCKSCSLVQLKHIVNPEVMFKNYLYIPSVSRTRVRDFIDIAQSAQKEVDLTKEDLVIDIGSNDGSLLTAFKNLGIKTLGIDPAENLVKVAELNGIQTELGYFDTSMAKKVVKTYSHAKVATATNVMAHIGDIHEMFKALDILLSDDGIFISQFPYILDLIQKNQFDTIYHEHLSYFSLHSLQELAKHSNLEIYDFKRNILDGGSIRIYWKKKTNKKLIVKKIKINKQLQLERKMGILNENIYKKFAKRVEKLREETTKYLKKLKLNNKRIIGYGAAAKGNILLNFYGLDNSTIDYVVDSTPYKQGKFTPGSHIPIKSELTIYETEPHYILLLAWNFKDEIIRKNLKYKRSGGKFIIPVPKIEVY